MGQVLKLFLLFFYYNYSFFSITFILFSFLTFTLLHHQYWIIHFLFLYPVDFIAELTHRCEVPFNGIAAIIHTNMEPNLSGTIFELSGTSELREGLTRFAHTGDFTPMFLRALEGALDRIRGEFR